MSSALNLSNNNLLEYDLLSGIIWNANLPSTTVTYYFHGADDTMVLDEGPDAAVYDDDDDEDDYEAVDWTDYEVQQVERVMSLYTDITVLEFVAVDSPDDAMLRLVASDFGPDNYGNQGLFVPPGVEDAGLGIFNITGFGWEREFDNGGISQGGIGFSTILHEFGHALGLAHPHDDGGGSTIFPGVEDENDVGEYALNQGIYTVMTYNDGWVTAPYGTPSVPGHGWSGTPMPLDIAALQLKYGINPNHNHDDSVYVLPDQNELGTFFATIWDTGGTDTIVSQSDANAHIDLRAATLVHEPGGGGYVSYIDGIHGGFIIAHGVVIENAIGGGGNDTFVGNAADNWFDGGEGRDSVYFNDAREHFTVDVTADAVYVSSGSTGNDTLVNIERVLFLDGTLAFDADAAPGQVFRLYQAAFDREADPIGLSYWVGAMEQDQQSFTWVAEHFVQSREFTDLYGPISSIDTHEYVSLLYANVLGRDTDASGEAYWEARLDDGMSAAAVLASFADSAENQARTEEQTADGIWFV